MDVLVGNIDKCPNIDNCLNMDVLVANIIDVWPVSTIIEDDISAYNGSYGDRGAILVECGDFS
jgi:hypothetical protein